MKNRLVPLKDYQLDNLKFGELLRRHDEDFASFPVTLVTDVPTKYYMTTLTSKSALFNKAIVKITEKEKTLMAAKSDKKRDLSASSLRKSIKVFLTSDVAAEVEAAHILLGVLKAYANLESYDYEKESNGIDKLVAELQGTTYSKYVTLLGITRYVTRLKTDNAAFRAVFASQMAATDAKVVYDVKALRADVADFYEEFTLYIQAMANVPSAQDQFIKVLSKLNTARKYFADSLAHHQGVLASNKEKAAATEGENNL